MGNARCEEDEDKIWNRLHRQKWHGIVEIAINSTGSDLRMQSLIALRKMVASPPVMVPAEVEKIANYCLNSCKVTSKTIQIEVATFLQRLYRDSFPDIDRQRFLDNRKKRLETGGLLSVGSSSCTEGYRSSAANANTSQVSPPSPLPLPSLPSSSHPLLSHPVPSHPAYSNPPHSNPPPSLPPPSVPPPSVPSPPLPSPTRPSPSMHLPSLPLPSLPLPTMDLENF